MWPLAGALWLAVKWLSVVDADRAAISVPLQSLVYYFCLYPNTDAWNFFSASVSKRKPVIREWLSGCINLSLGIVLIYGVVRFAHHASPLLAGWTGMIGLVLVLHFGVLKVIALAWQNAGRGATLLMCAPLRANSVAEFWGRRWNTGFSQPARRLLFEPLGKRIGVGLATLCVFAISGLLHELVISLPARGGFGGPMAYFLVQAAALQLERSQFGTRLALSRSSWRGRLFALIAAAGPAFWLFPPPFIERVMLPFLRAMGALKGVAL